MMVRLAVLIVALAGAAAAQQNSGLDELTTREDLRGWEPVGRVDIEDGGFCTGTLVASDLVLTAGHCVLEPGGAPIQASRITFRAGFAYGTSIAESGVLRTVTHPDYRNVDPSPAGVIRLDVALLQLAQPIPSSVISPFAIGRPGTGDEVSVVSYAAGREEALSWQRVCQILAQQDDLIAVDCDVTFGSSGAPVLDRSGYRARIVSIISAGGEYDGRRVAYGMELPGIFETLKAALRRGDTTSVAEIEVETGTNSMPGKPARRLVPDGSGQSGARFVKP
jgi:protease YdgD